MEQVAQKVLKNPVSMSQTHEVDGNCTRSAVEITLVDISRMFNIACLRYVSDGLSEPADVYTPRPPCPYFVKQLACTPLNDRRYSSEYIQERGEVIWGLFCELE